MASQGTIAAEGVAKMDLVQMIGMDPEEVQQHIMIDVATSSSRAEEWYLGLTLSAVTWREWSHRQNLIGLQMNPCLEMLVFQFMCPAWMRTSLCSASHQDVSGRRGAGMSSIVAGTVKTSTAAIQEDEAMQQTSWESMMMQITITFATTTSMP